MSNRKINLAGVAYNRLDDGTPKEIWFTEGQDFQTIKPKNAPYDVNIYKAIEKAIEESIINIEGVNLQEGNNITITGTGSSDDPYIISTQIVLDAENVTNIPQGNLTSTNVQDALNELQTDIDNIVISGGSNIYSADGTLMGTRVVSLDGNSITFKENTSEILINANELKTTGVDLEVDQSIIRHSADGTRWSENKTNIGSTITTQL